MIDVICDTMIWYGLGNGSIELPDPEKYRPICTYLSLSELAFTPNNFGKLNEVQRTVKYILDLQPALILQSPFSHAKQIVDPNHRLVFNVQEDVVFNFLGVLLNHPQEGLLENEFKEQLTNLIDQRRKNKTDWATFLNELNEPAKEYSRIYKRYADFEVLRNIGRQKFAFNLNQLSEDVYHIDPVNWQNFEFYEAISTQYKRNLLISKMKAGINDDNDLNNMIYVQPGNLYWTLERRWLSLAREANIGNYLYNHD